MGPPSVLKRHWRAIAFPVVAAAAIFGLGARCIERTHVYVDKDGYTHITGEMVNDTDIQGTRIMLRGTLYDAADNVIATKDAPTCPPDTQPHQQTAFDIRFDNPNIPPHARYEVRPISGITLEQPLPNPDVVLFSAEAARFQGLPPIPGLPISDDDVFFTFTGRNRSGVTYHGVQGCSAVYDQQGNVVHVQSTELISIDEEGNITPASMDSAGPYTTFMIAEDVPKGPVQVRVWIWFGPKDAPTSQYQFVATQMIAIQTINFP
jgi:hypothetical protein